LRLGQKLVIYKGLVLAVLVVSAPDRPVGHFERKATGLVKEISPFRTLVLYLMFTSPSFMFLFSILGIGIFPGANMIVSTFIALLLGFVAAGMYSFLATAFPRSGGDYVFISRIISPPLGFTINFVLTIVNISVIGTEAVWLSTMALGPMFSGLGTMYGSSYLGSIASIFSNNLYIVTIGTIVLVVLSIVMFLGTTPAFRLKSALFFIAIISIIVYVVAIGFLPHNVAVSNFNKYSSTPFDNYSSLVSSNGLPASFSTGPTLLA
jgi:APA family basic amino acid/polyamine antiporter